MIKNSEQAKAHATSFQDSMERFIFFSRWLQAPIYLGLVVALGAYLLFFVKEVWHLVSHINGLTESEIVLGVLSLIDVAMIGNLIIVVVIGGYITFVSKLDFLEGHVDKPEWLEHIDAGTLKIKLATSLIGVSAVHLLKTFMTPKEHNTYEVAVQIAIHMTLIFSALLLAYTDKLMNSNKNSAGSKKDQH